MGIVTPADLVLRFDSNLLGMLVNDNGQKVLPSQLNTDAPTLAAIDDATGMAYSGLLVAYKYTAAEVEAVAGPTRSLLKRLICDLAIVMLCQRRAYDYSDKYPMLNVSLETIQLLRNGERVLDLAANEKAGLAAASHVTLVQQERAGLVITNFRYFPARGCGGEGLHW